MALAGCMSVQAQGLKDVYKDYFMIGVAVNQRNVSNPEHVVARTTNAAEIRIGVLERLEEKAKYTTSFLEDLRTTKRPIEYIDLTYTQAVIPKQDPVQK